MSNKKRNAAGQAPDPAFAEIDALVERVEAEFKAILEMVKPEHRARFLAIVEHTDAYCMNHLEPLHREYEALSHLMAAVLCQDGSPVVEGRAKAEGWGAAIVAALGFVNFLSDASFPPVKTMEEVAAGFGVSASGMHAKSRQIREMLDLFQFDPDWTLPSLLGRNPLVWMLETRSGLIVDIRMLPREEQVKAFEAGLIPYVPADREPEEGPREARRVVGAKQDASPVGETEQDSGPTLFDAACEPPVVETRPEQSPDVVGRIGPATTTGRR